MAARSLGYRIHVMDPDPSCPARFVVDACFEGDWDDAHAAADLARGSDVVTLEIEQISIECLEAAAKYAPVRPVSRAAARYPEPHSPEGLAARARISSRSLACRALRTGSGGGGCESLGGRCFVKSAERRLRRPQPGRRSVLATALLRPKRGACLEQKPCVVEQAIDLDLEISVMVARSPRGETKSFPSATNHHENQILAWSVIPSLVSPQIEARAQKLACEIADSFTLEGLLAVEMFLTKEWRPAGERAGAAPAQQLSRQRARLRHQPVRAVRARGLRSCR